MTASARRSQTPDEPANAEDHVVGMWTRGEAYRGAVGKFEAVLKYMTLCAIRRHEASKTASHGGVSKIVLAHFYALNLSRQFYPIDEIFLGRHHNFHTRSQIKEFLRRTGSCRPRPLSSRFKLEARSSECCRQVMTEVMGDPSFL